MPPAIIPAAIAGGSAVVGGILGNRAQNKATEAQQRASDAALAYQREQAQREEAWKQRAYDQWLAGRQALLQRFGISLPQAQAPAAGGPMGPPSMSPMGGGMPPGMSLGMLARGGPDYAGMMRR